MIEVLRRPVESTQDVTLSDELALLDLELRDPALSRAMRCAGVSFRPASAVGDTADAFNGLRAAVPSAAVFRPVPYRSSHSRNMPRSTPRSAAMPPTVAPGVDSYKSTACRQNSSKYMILIISLCTRNCGNQRVQNPGSGPGLLFLLVGTSDVRPLAAMAGKPFRGKDFRSSLDR